MLIALLLQLASAESPADRLFSDHMRLTTAIIRCPERADPNEVVVCGRRRADGFRLPFEVAPDPGDPRHEGVLAERERWQGRSNNCAEKRAFLVGCGLVGVHVTTDGRGTRAGGLRDLSP